ncbi:hypothetical protein LWI29_023533 [Acer saccharum]|uniref:CCHC-type domain-containing protein n=1 Tax=Acer saccharum TaxID=4024 RepID=A0AA39VY35_ACESA|nr:hypothetical protein LWI29_023533 [Acer saccharum]
MTDVTDVVRLNDRIEKQRVYMFLAGLDFEFDKVQADVLHMDPFPSVEGAFAYIRHEAQRQTTMLASPQVSNSSALLINKGNSGDRKCTHCGQKNHIRDACWRLNGYPECLRSQSSEKENLSSESEIPDSLTEKTEPTLRVYERRNKGKEKQGESVLIQVVQPSSSPSPIRQSNSEVENAPEVTLEPFTLSNDLSSENHTDPDPSLSTKRYPSREHRPSVRFGFSPKRPPTDSKALYSISDYTSSHRLSKTFKAFAHQLSSVSIPSKLHDALTDQNWV